MRPELGMSLDETEKRPVGDAGGGGLQQMQLMWPRPWAKRGWSWLFGGVRGLQLS